MKFIWILGPQAVGKMTIGKLVSERTDVKLFYNHQSIELALEYFPYGSPGFKKINAGIRSLLMDANQEFNDKGLIFTYLADFDSEHDVDYIRKTTEPFTEKGWEVYYIELEADLSTRLERNVMEDRIAAKPSKKDTDRTTKAMISSMERYRMNTDGDFPFDTGNYLKLDTVKNSKEEAAEKIIEFCELAGSS